MYQKLLLSQECFPILENCQNDEDIDTSKESYIRGVVSAQHDPDSIKIIEECQIVKVGYLRPCL